MAKEKFELVFMAGGSLLNVLGTRLRRDPATPRESVGAAMHALDQVFTQHRDQLADAAPVARQIGAIREELCAARPRRLQLLACLDELACQVRAVDDLADAVAELREETAGYLG
jgi:hypothetical protein